MLPTVNPIISNVAFAVSLADVTLPVTAGHSELPDKKKVAYFFARKKL